MRLSVGVLGALCAALVTSVAAAQATPERGHLTQTITRGAAVVAPTLSTGPVRLKGLEQRVRRELNRYRRNHGRKKVKAQKQLRRAAIVHARAMAAKGFFSHDSVNGETFDTRVKRYYRVAGFRTWRVGENLVWASGSLSAKRAIRLWRDSPGHRRNMLERGWRQIGVAAVRMRAASGVFRGFDVTIVVTDFGTRS